ncbi:MAG: Tandem-95 repeat protein, partial [Candidatus Poribacteria bacterium]|nr:Tandem-95 repeat protein [Candidatus Poribacteria bacterium]
MLILLIIPLLSQASSPFKQNFFDGKLRLSNAPSVGQKAIMTLDLTDVSGNCNATTIKFNVPGGVSLLGSSIFRESSFVKGLTRQYTAEIEVFEEGIYALQASVYFEISKNRYDVEHFFTYLVAGKANSWVASSVDHLTQTKNGIDFHIQKLAPSKSTNAMGTLSLQGYITYYDDNLSRSVPIRNVMVQLYEINQNNPELMGYTYTDSDGLYVFDTTNATKLGDGNPKDIQPKIVFDNDVIKLVNNNNEIYTFTLPLIPNVSAGSINIDYFLNESNQQRPVGHLFNTIMDAYDFLQKNLNWKRKKLNLKWPYQADNSSYNYTYTALGSIVSEYIRIPGNKQWDRTSMIHEYGHSVMMALYGYNLFNQPKEKYKGTHYINTVSDEGFAMKEGWAEFFVALVDDNAFGVTQFSNLKTPNIEYNEWWNGDGNNTNGAIVEGTISSILWDIADTAQSKDEVPEKDDDNISGIFGELWNLMSNNKPQSILEVLDKWQNNNYGQVEYLQSIFTNNGIKVAIKPVNHSPTADAKTVETDEDIPLVIKLTGSDTDNDALTYTIVE